jgi:hypothetical protein
MEDRILVTQIIDPVSYETLVAIYNADHDDQLTVTSKMPLSEVLEKYDDILTEEQKNKLKNYGK